MAKLDRLLKRFFQIKAMKPLMGLGEPLAPVIGQRHAGVGVNRRRGAQPSPDAPWSRQRSLAALPPTD